MYLKDKDTSLCGITNAGKAATTLILVLQILLVPNMLPAFYVRCIYSNTLKSIGRLCQTVTLKVGSWSTFHLSRLGLTLAAGSLDTCISFSHALTGSAKTICPRSPSVEELF